MTLDQLRNRLRAPRDRGMLLLSDQDVAALLAALDVIECAHSDGRTDPLALVDACMRLNAALAAAK